MIITILGADFSASNIGTLSSYLVRYTGNVTGNVTSVEKNDAGTSAKAALTATITMKSGFTYESLSVTVGGSTITGYTATDNGNGTVSLTVPANLITGTVVVSVVTTGSSVNPPSGKPEEPGTGGVSGTQLISTFRDNPANAQYVHDGTYKVVNGVVSFAGNGKTYKYFILPLDVFNITDLKCITGMEGSNDISPIVFLKNNEMKSENIVGDLTFGKTQKIDGATIHTSFMYYNGGFPSIPEGANYVAFSDFIDRETLKVSDEKLTITFG